MSGSPAGRPTAGRDLRTVAAAVLALFPGFAFPFLLAWSLGSQSSDRLLLAASVALTLANVVGNAVEANSVSEIGRLVGRDAAPDLASLRSYRRRTARFAVAATLLLGGVLVVVYGLRTPDPQGFARVAGLMLVVAVLGGLAGTYSGELLAYGVVTLPVVLQALRTVVPAVLVLTWRSSPLVLVAAGFVVGELARLLLLVLAARRNRARVAVAPAELPTSGLLWQSASAFTAQSGPVTDRVFLASAPTGALSAYEMADKLFFAAVQVLNLGLLVRRLAGWSRLPATDPALGRAMLRRDLRVLLVATGVLGVLGSAALAWLASSGLLPTAWHQGLVWGAILFLSLPLSMSIMAGGRLLIVARQQRLLIGFASFFAVANAVLDWVFFTLYGPVGIPVATVIVRGGSALLYLIVLTRLLPRLLGADLVADPDRTPAAAARP